MRTRPIAAGSTSSIVPSSSTNARPGFSARRSTINRPSAPPPTLTMNTGPADLGAGAGVAIGAACVSAGFSIVAKHVRDEMMIAAAETWPAYGWQSNKGYGSATHLAALREHGPTPLHRRSFAPVAQCYLDL